MVKKTTYIVLFFISIILASCSVPRSFTSIDVLRPAKVTFRPEAKNVVIVINTATQPENVGHIVFKEDKARNESLKFDSAAIFCTASLRENLESKEFFNSVNLSLINRNSFDNYYKISPLDKNDVRQLCQIYSSDAVISLDQINTIDKTGSWYTSNSSRAIFATDVIVQTTWSIHYPKSDIKPIYVQFADSVSWESYTKRDLPIRYNTLVDATILAGSNIADRLVPCWEQQDRFFYSPKNKQMQQAMDSVSHRKWKAAIKIWEKKLRNDSKNINLQYQAANNIAISYEILQDYDNALKYASLATRLYPKVTTYTKTMANSIYSLMNYIKFLEKRKEEVKVLNQQLAEEE